ncbi:MAG TPA: ATP-dependent zinc metalloprotease FtsH [Acidimicrobiales bacterium]|nr:ATP-dependent zinc metalloprotease FtsH [Acidimicrobiales bacterium]
MSVPTRQSKQQDETESRQTAPPPPPRWRPWLLLVGIVVTLMLLFAPAVSRNPTRTLTYSQFVSSVDANGVKTASIDPNGHVTGTLKGGATYTTQIPTALSPGGQLTSSLQRHHVQITAVASSVSVASILLSLLPLALFIGLFWWIGRRATRQLAGGMGGIMGFGSSKAKVYDTDRPATTFADVAGYDSAKREVSEVVDFLKHPEKYELAGAVGPRGVLLVGPPGTGKTLIARAVAGEAEVPFLALTGSSFVELFVGVGASRVRDLFADARKRAPAIIFIDEIDAIGGRRGGGFVNNDEREQTLNQLLAEMDGFDPATGVVVIAATNRPEILDPALLRPGRFDRQVEIPLPNRAERAAILAVHTRGKHVGPDVDLDVVARSTPGFSGADLANLVNEAAIVAVRDNRQTISAKDFDEARDRILIGRREATNALMPDEKRSVAVHESGHALVAALSEHADPVAKVTILPAGQALGVTEQLPADERHLYPESYLLDSLAVRLGGRSAELLVMGEASTGAANDLAGATQLAVHMVRDWGLSPRLGPIGFGTGSSAYLGPDEVRPRPYAEGTQLLIDEEVSRILTDAQRRATDLLTANRRALDELADLLVERETVTGDEIDALLDRVRSTPAPALVS